MGTEFWTKAIAKETANIRIEFENLDDVTHDGMRKRKIKPGYEHVNVHMIFDIKMNGKFTRKARLVANGHTKAPPSSITYSRVVYRESVMIAFLLAYLNDLDIFTCDIGNEHLNAKHIEKLWTETGTEFGTEKGVVMIIARVLYGIKSSGAAWREKPAENLMSLGYKSSEEDANVWMKQDFNRNGDPYYKCILCYVDDFLHMGLNPNPARSRLTHSLNSFAAS